MAFRASCGTGILPVRTAKMAVPHFGRGNFVLCLPTETRTDY